MNKIKFGGDVNNTSSVLTSTYIWEIQPYRDVINDLEMEEPLESEMFSITSNFRDFKFKIRMYPKGREDSKEHISVYLYSYNNDAIKLEYKFLLGENREFKCTHVFNQNDYGWGDRYFVQFNELFLVENGFIVDEKLTILCEIKIDMCCACNKQPSDVKFIIDNRELYAHKKILAAYSTIFTSMFEKDWTENSFTITDVNEDAFNALLQFVYIQNIIYDEFSAIRDIMNAGARYGIQQLKSECENKFCEIITIDNVCDCLNLSENRNLNKLKLKCIEFIYLQGRQMIINKTFESVTNLTKDLIIELLSFSLLQDK